MAGFDDVFGDDSDAVEVFSPSRLQSAAKCGRLFYYVYVQGRRQPPNGSLTRGSCVHAAQEKNYEQKIVTTSDLSVEEVLDEFSTHWDRRVKGEEFNKWKNEWVQKEPPRFEEDEIAGSCKDSGVMMSAAYHKMVAPEIQPVAVERKLEGELDGHKILGFTDVEDATTIRDTKTAGKKKTQGWVQAFFYRHMVPDKEFAFDVLVQSLKDSKGNPYDPARIHDKPVAYYEMGAEIPEAAPIVISEMIADVKGMVQAGLFPRCSPDNWYCSSRWCGFYDTDCYPKRNQTPSEDDPIEEPKPEPKPKKKAAAKKKKATPKKKTASKSKPKKTKAQSKKTTKGKE